MTVSKTRLLKEMLGRVPFTAELYYLCCNQGEPIKTRFSLKQLKAALPELVEKGLNLRKQAPPGKKIFLFAPLHYWIEHTALISAALASQGHQVTLGYLPYSDWTTPINRFDLRRQNAYAKSVLSLAAPLFQSVSFLKKPLSNVSLPQAVLDSVREVTAYDTQYTMQVEEVNEDSPVYKLRYERNLEAARVGLAWLQKSRPNLVIVPNGTILEMGIIYRLARFMKIPVTTYEFGDERQHIWLAQNEEIMRQNTDRLWEARRNDPLTEEQMERMRSLISARQRATLWENFARLWQGVPTQGGKKVRQQLRLDDRPIVLLATNVLGDSLTLGRQVFSRNMSEWIARTVQYFAGRDDVQFIIRVHPGEVLTHGLSMKDVVLDVLPELPEHIHLIGPQDKVNTYDIVEIADVGLVYSTTVGLEMAMSGKPVIVAGKTHYRGRGFTHDVETWVDYYKLLGKILADPKKYQLTREEVERAWKYAYCFFFEFPRPFPWHLVRVWEDYQARPLDHVMNNGGQAQFGKTFRLLAGEPINWKELVHE